MSFSCDEQYDVHAKTRRKARKQHQCDACENIIMPGHYYMRIYTVYDGTSDTIVRCGACELTHVHLVKVGCDHDMYPMERLDCGESYQSEWKCDPPAEIAALPFLIGDDVGKLLAPT